MHHLVRDDAIAEEGRGAAIGQVGRGEVGQVHLQLDVGAGPVPEVDDTTRAAVLPAPSVKVDSSMLMALPEPWMP